MLEKFVKGLVNFFRDFKYLRFPVSTAFAILGVLLSFFYINSKEFRITAKAPISSPASKPFNSSISGTAIVESVGKNIDLASYYAGRVAEVYIEEGIKVSAGTPLFKLNDLEDKAKLAAIQAEYEAQLAMLKNLKQQYQRLENLENKAAVPAQEIESKALDLEKANADLKKLEARIIEQKLVLEHALIRSPVKGTVLQVNVREGEYVSASANPAPVVLAEDSLYQIRVDVDEINAPYIKVNQPAFAFLKGNSEKKFPLKFVRIEPYMVPKKDLTGNTAERNDIRVLQIIYHATKPDFPLYMGQQLEVYIEKS